MELELMQEGKEKDVYRVIDGPENSIALRFVDQIYLFDVARTKDIIPGKGASVCACTRRSAEIAEALGVKTHFIRQLDAETILVHEAQNIPDIDFTTEDENYVLPTEWIHRNYVFGSIDRDFKSKKKRPDNFGLPSVIPTIGTKFPRPLRMYTTKFEKIDRDISPKEMRKMSGLTEEDEQDYWQMIGRIIGAISIEFHKIGMTVVDGKFDCIMGPGREKMLGMFGTPDVDRYCMTKPFDAGKFIHFSKEYLRQVHIGNGYLEKVQLQRQFGPVDLPHKLPAKNIRVASSRYLIVAEKYAGVQIKV